MKSFDCRSLAAVAATILLASFHAAPAAAQPSKETIVFMRHGEKPAAGLGQLDCQGLNRALGLTWVLISRYGEAGFVFAPDPSKQIEDHGKRYNYVRPLATIEPTAIKLGRPVDTRFGYRDVEALQRELLQPTYRDALVFVAWEHRMLVEAVRGLIAKGGGDPLSVPDWSESDFDSLYVLTLTRQEGKLSATFSRQQQGLNGRATSCP